MPPRLEGEGAVGDDVFGLRPGGESVVDLAVPEDHVFRHGEPGVVLGDLWQERDRARSCTRSVCASGADTPTVEKSFVFPVWKASAPDDVVEHERVLRGQIRGEDALEGEQEILRRERLAVRPDRVLAQVEDPLGGVLGRSPPISRRPRGGRRRPRTGVRPTSPSKRARMMLFSSTPQTMCGSSPFGSAVLPISRTRSRVARVTGDSSSHPARPIARTAANSPHRRGMGRRGSLWEGMCGEPEPI